MTLKDIEGWATIKLIRGIPVKYKKELYLFPVVRMRESGVDDFDMASKSVEVKEAKENGDSDSILTLKFIELLCRLPINAAYPVDAIETVESNYKVEKEIKKLEDKLGSGAVSEEREKHIREEIETLKAKLLPVVRPFADSQEVIPFRSSDLTSQNPKVRTADYTRILQAYQALNLVGEDELNDFFTC